MGELNSFDENIGHRIKLSRERAGLTQEQLAEQVDKSLSFISMLEQGRSGAKVSTLKDICVALNASADFIILGITSGNEDLVIAQKLRLLKYSDKTALLQIIDSLSEDSSIGNDPDLDKLLLHAITSIILCRCIFVVFPDFISCSVACLAKIQLKSQIKKSAEAQVNTESLRSFMFNRYPKI